MKKFLINNCMKYIEKNTHYEKTKLAEIKYGLESIYLSYSKLIIISILAIILGIFKEMVIYLLIYNLIRMPSFGLHATKSWICLLFSAILFIGVPYLCIVLTIPIILKIIIGIVGALLMFKNSPADTKKKPIINKKRRKVYKILSVILAIIFAICSILIKNNFISNCFLLGLVMQNFMIAPTIYKIFKLPYNNYITFLKEHPEYSN